MKALQLVEARQLARRVINQGTLPPHLDGEDLAQDAVLEVLKRESSVRRPAPYAAKTAVRSASRERERASRERISVDEVRRVLQGGDGHTEELKRWLHADAALEQLIVWGVGPGTGVTQAQFFEGCQFDSEVLARKVEFYLSTIRMCCSGRQYQRVKARLFDNLLPLAVARSSAEKVLRAEIVGYR